MMRAAGPSSKLPVKKGLPEMSKTHIIMGASRNHYSDMPREALEQSR